MKRYLIPILIISVLVSVFLLGCSSVPSSEPTSTQTPTTAESQAEIEALKEELNQLREQKKAEILEGAEAYYAILEFCAAGSSEPSGIRRATAESVAEVLKACGEFWGLIKATKDPELISRCQPQGEWHLTPCRCSQVKDYCWSMYKKLIAEYNELQLPGGQLIIPRPPAEKTEEQVVDPLPFTYTGKGEGRTPVFKLEKESLRWPTKYKLTFTTTWDGNISITWYGIANNIKRIYRSTGTSPDFPNYVKSGVSYEFAFIWDMADYNCYLSIEDAPPEGNWTISISRVGIITSSPKVHITVVVEYDGKWHGELKGGSAIDTSGDRSLTWEDVEVPVEYSVWRMDEGTSPMTLKFIYDGQVVAHKTVVDHDEVHVIWLGPQ